MFTTLHSINYLSTLCFSHFKQNRIQIYYVLPKKTEFVPVKESGSREAQYRPGSMMTLYFHSLSSSERTLPKVAATNVDKYAVILT